MPALFLTAALVGVGQAQDTNPEVTLFTNVDVFDGVNEALIENANVVVTGKITAVSTEPLAVAGGRVIDGGGRTLMPGNCADVVDLSVETIRRRLRIKWRDLECPNWESDMNKGIEPSCHTITKRLIEDGYAGIIVNSFARSATPDHLNLVLWRWDDVTESGEPSRHAVRVLERDQLPHSDASRRR